MRIVKHVAPAALILGLAVALPVVRAADMDDSRQVVIAAMRRVFTGPNALIGRAAAGEAGETEKQRLLKVLTGMAAVLPAHGDAASWKARTEALVAAAQDLVDGKEGARDRLRGFRLQGLSPGPPGQRRLIRRQDQAELVVAAHGGRLATSHA